MSLRPRRHSHRALGLLLAAAAAGLLAIGCAIGWTLVHEPGNAVRLSCSRWDRGYCHSVTGRVVAREETDPDHDGDLHLVLASRESLSAPGVTILKIPRALRPDKLPGFGHWVTAIGFTFRGEHGRDQLQVRRMIVG
jgi:hypothetical protein